MRRGKTRTLDCMTVEIADAERFRTMLEAELRRHGRQPVELVIVDDVAAWASSRQRNGKGNPPAMAITDTASGAWGIVLRRRIDADWVSSIIGRIEFGSNTNVRARRGCAGGRSLAISSPTRSTTRLCLAGRRLKRGAVLRRWG